MVWRAQEELRPKAQSRQHAKRSRVFSEHFAPKARPKKFPKRPGGYGVLVGTLSLVARPYPGSMGPLRILVEAYRDVQTFLINDQI
jgi:hypothetical protein